MTTTEQTLLPTPADNRLLLELSNIGLLKALAHVHFTESPILKTLPFDNEIYGAILEDTGLANAGLLYTTLCTNLLSPDDRVFEILADAYDLINKHIDNWVTPQSSPKENNIKYIQQALRDKHFALNDDKTIVFGKDEPLILKLDHIDELLNELSDTLNIYFTILSDKVCKEHERENVENDDDKDKE